MAKLWSQRGLEAPEAVRDQLALTQYGLVRQHQPWLYLSIAVMTLAGFLTDNAEPRSNTEWAISALLTGVVVTRWITLLRGNRQPINPARARRRLNAARKVILGSILCCAAWVLSELQSEPAAHRDLIMLLVVLGSLATASCYASCPRTAMIPLLLGCMPIVLVLMQTPDLHAQALALAVAMVSIQQARMIVGRYYELLDHLLLQHQMQTLAETDPLTGLLNRRAITDRLAERIDQVEDSRSLAIALFDLDGFKPVNDRHGHAAGDLVLKQVARRMTLRVQDAGVVGRLGGDEFIIIFDADAAARADDICHDIVTGFVEAFDLGDARVRLGISHGMATWPDQGQTQADLLVAADRALYAVKAQGRARRLGPQAEPRRAA